MSGTVEQGDIVVGYSHLDDKGRVVLSKAIREALGLSAGTLVAAVKVGGGVLLVPLDDHLAEVMDAAARVLERAQIDVAAVLATLPEIRDEVTLAHYGPDFGVSLRRTTGEPSALVDER